MRSDTRPRHRRRLPLAVVATLAAIASASPPAAALDDAGYWALADATQLRLDRFWNDGADSYRVGGGGADPSVNGQLLLAHAVAAQRGHTGPTRRDARARRIARRLVRGVPFVERPGRGQGHAPGWVNSMSSAKAEQHLVFDAQVVDGLAAAWRARRELDLPDETVRLIEDRIARTAAGRFWRYPSLRLNQVNWYALMYSAAAEVTGDARLLRRDLRLQIERFVRGIGARGRAAGNLGPGGHFHYLPHQPASHPMNVDSAEYANVVMSLTRFLDAGRAGGMRLSDRTRSTLRTWATRVISGYWTHGGYLNWDTGLGFERWHQAKKLGLVQEALIGLAADDTLRLPARWKRWSKHLLDRGLELYERTAEREGGIPAPIFFGITAHPQGAPSARLAAARMVANAARAVDAGLGRAEAAMPPPLYSYDPDIGRLAVTTPYYNTAVIAVNNRAFPYGGLELARLFDARQDVAGTTGGTAAAAFGLVVRGANGDRVLATQTPRRAPGRSPVLRLTQAPRRPSATASVMRPGRVYAGPFTRLAATGTTSAGGLTARTTHRFGARSITTRWDLRRSGTSRSLAARVQFPSWGAGARVLAVMRDGRTRRLGRTPLALRRVARFLVRSEHTGYEVRVLRAPRDAVAAALAVRPQQSAPRPGPSLSIRIATGTEFRTAALTARLTMRP